MTEKKNVFVRAWETVSSDRNVVGAVVQLFAALTSVVVQAMTRDAKEKE